MKLSVRFSYLISMLSLGIICGIVFYIAVIPFYGSSLVHCLAMGIIFGFANYLVSYRIFQKYTHLKQTNEFLQQNISIDKLTGLLNRRAFDSDIAEFSSNSSYSMIFIDIDDFRKFNNEFGHKAGDTVLKKVCQSIRVNFDPHDKVYRYGGEEIVIILKNTCKKNAIDIAEKIRLAIERLDNSPLPGISISLGVSNYPDDGKSVCEIIEICDNALLTAKKLGKNLTYAYLEKVQKTIPTS